MKGDKQEAQKWFRKAVGLLRPIAETGDTSACRVLAQCYSNGKGVEKDFDEGMRWMRKSIKDIAGKINGQRGVVK